MGESRTRAQPVVERSVRVGAAWLATLACLAPLAPTPPVALPAPAVAASSAPPCAEDVVGQLLEPQELTGATFQRDGLSEFGMQLWRRPLLVVSWRADDKASVEAAVPDGLALLQRYGADLAVLFIERSGLSQREMLKVVARRGWLCSDALWTTRPVAHTDTGSTPSFVLTSLWGRVTLAGVPADDRSRLLDALDLVVAERRHGSADLPPEARDAWSALAEGRLVRALGVFDAAQRRRASGDLAVADVLDREAGMVQSEIQNRLSLCDELLRAGAADVGMQHALGLAQQLHTLPAEHVLRQQADTGVVAYQCGDRNPELEGGAQLTKLLAQLCSKGPGDPLERAFRRVAKDHRDTRAAARALELAALAAPD